TLMHLNFKGSILFTLIYCKKMHIFSIFKNNLSENIPTQIFGYQEGLVNFDLSTNSFIDSIPLELGNLMHISKLYMYANKFCGVIPWNLVCNTIRASTRQKFLLWESTPFLGSLRSLESNLNLSYNHLYGQVSLEGVFSNITIISLIGNNDLYGGIPQLNLSPCPDIYCLRKKSKKLSFSPSLKHRYLKVSYGELHQATNGFSSSNLVDTGSSGSVYRETLVYFERPVAVKVLNLQTGGASKSFMAECKALGIIKHRNLLSLLASCSSVNYKENDFKAIVFEFMSNRSLKTLLYNTIEDSESTNLSLNLMQRVNIALDIAFALDYIHNDSGVVIHCDIKPSNMLLDDDIVARLGDFGLARLISRGQKLFYQ
ncbi:hypothetical protein HN51_058137, partial [Arachis hypogaea]